MNAPEHRHTFHVPTPPPQALEIAASAAVEAAMGAINGVLTALDTCTRSFVIGAVDADRAALRVAIVIRAFNRPAVRVEFAPLDGEPVKALFEYVLPTAN